MSVQQKTTSALVPALIFVGVLLFSGVLWTPREADAFVPVISGVNVASNCNTSALVNFNTSNAAHAHIEYGTTISYGASTIDDPARYFREHAIQLTGLSAGTLYHYRVVATDTGGTTTG